MSKPTSAHVALSLHAELRIGKHALDLGEMRTILRAVADARSIVAACETVGTTYRTLWGRLEFYSEALGHSVVDKSPGQGSQLTATGRALLAVLDTHTAQLQGPDPALAQALCENILSALGGAQAPLRFHASHDFAIARCVADRSISGVEVHYSGSADSARALVRGEADLAGFHVSALRNANAEGALQTVLDSVQFWSAPLMEREQGIMVARGNPKRIKSLTDLAKPGVRFINRQRGSGTRILLDQLLQSAGLTGQGIAGYDEEEYTHQAVAAMIGASAADAGLGLRAAAAQFKLDFVPLSKEIYFLSARSELQRDASVNNLIAQIKQQAGHLEGYVVL
jgi:putative molybdopterin biosynthesis protein